MKKALSLGGNELNAGDMSKRIFHREAVSTFQFVLLAFFWSLRASIARPTDFRHPDSVHTVYGVGVRLLEALSFDMRLFVEEKKNIK